MRVSVIIPSILRPQIFSRAVRSVCENTLGHSVEIIVITEDINTLVESNKLRAELENGRLKFIEIYHEERLGYMAAWNEGLKYISGDIIFPIGDDGVLTAGAFDKVLDLHQNKLGGYGVVGFNDGYIPSQVVVTHFILDREFITHELGGVLLCPHYKAFFADTEVNERAKRINKLAWDDTAFLWHEHNTRDKRPTDEIDLGKGAWWEYDEQLFLQRKAAGFPNDYEAILS